jgi:hypothetical protein
VLGDAGDNGVEIAVLAPQSVKPAKQIVFIGQHGGSNRGILSVRKP